MAGRKYCKNTVKGKQPGKKYPAALRAEVVMAMLRSNSICAVARKYQIPESTIRSWMAKEAEAGDVFAQERRKAAREIAVRAALGATAQVGYLQKRVDESARAAEIVQRLHQRLDEDTRAQSDGASVGMLLKSDEEMLADAAETALVVRDQPGTYDRQLWPAERKKLMEELERYEARRMSDKNAAAIARALMQIAQTAAELVPAEEEQEASAQPVIQIGAVQDDPEQKEVILDD